MSQWTDRIAYAMALHEDASLASDTPRQALLGDLLVTLAIDHPIATRRACRRVSAYQATALRKALAEQGRELS